MENVTDNELSLVVVLLDGRTYAAAQLVNRQWARVTKSPEVRKERFRREWGMVHVRGTPRNSCFLEKNDSLAKLAVKYCCSVMDLKIINNLTSEHALMSRNEIFVQVRSKEEVHGQLGQLYYSSEAKREYALVLPPDHVFEESIDFGLAPSSQWIFSDSPKADRVRKQLVRMLCRTLKIDELVAEAYLSVADWNPIKAMEQYKQDDCWQGQKHL